MSLWDRGLVDELSQINKCDSIGDTNEKGRLEKITVYLIVYFILTYPFTLLGFIPFLVVKKINKNDEEERRGQLNFVPLIERQFPIYIIGTLVFFLLNLWLLCFKIPNAYLSNYLLFPFNFLKSKLTYNLLSLVTLIIGATGQSFTLLAISSYVSKRKIVSIDERQEKIQKSKTYQDLKENKFSHVRAANRRYNYEKNLSVLSDDVKEQQTYDGKVFMGVDEFGKNMLIDFKELNQHALATGTTGSGKTTLIMNFVDYAIGNDIPILYIDGKGAVDTLKSVQTIASKYKKKVKVFSDTNDLRYNPIKHGNAVMVRDRLISLAETESVFYTASAKSLLQSTVQLIDMFEIPRTLENISDYTLPRNVLLLFLEVIQQQKPDVLFVEVEQIKEKEGLEKSKKETPISYLDVERNNHILSDRSSEALNDHNEVLQPDSDTNNGQTCLKEIDPNTIPLIQLYDLIRYHEDYLSVLQQKIFKQLFIRYEHKESPFYLYETSESLQTNINMLIDSDLGHLFDTTESGCEELDLLADSKKNEVIFITLNGLVYKDYIKTLAQFFISELNYLASEHYIYNEFLPFLLICDEPSVYLNENFIDTVNKGRGAGLHTVFSPQTLADIDIINPLLTKQLVGNCNSYFIGQSNIDEEINSWASLIGTYRDVELTTTTEQEQGYSDGDRLDWRSKRGTTRNVRNFIIHPDSIRDLRQGEFMVYRKAGNVREQARRLYANNPADR